MPGVRFKTKYLYLIILIGLLFGGFALRNFPFTHGDLSEDSPAVRTTYDAFYHTIYSKAVFDQEDVRYWPEFGNSGIKTVWLQPPLLYTFIGSFANLTSMPFYRLFFALICFLGIWIPFQVYALFRKYFGENVAILGLTFALFPTGNWMMFYVMGFSMDFLAFLIVPFALFLVLEYLKKPKILFPIIFGTSIGFSALAHTYQAVFAVMMFTLLFLILLLSRKISIFNLLKFVLFSSIFVLISVLNYIPLFIQGHGGGGEKLTSWIAVGTIKKVPEYLWPISYHWILIIGFIALLCLLVLKYKSILKGDKFVLVLFCAIGVAFFFLLFLGFDGLRVIRHQFLFYNLVVFLSAIGYIGLFGLIKSKNRFWIIIFFMLIVAILFFPKTYSNIENINTQTMFTEDKWEAVKYIRDNVPKNATIFVHYGYFHHFTEFAERVSFNVEFGRDYTQESYQKLCGGVMPKIFNGTYIQNNYYNTNQSQLVIGRQNFWKLKTIPVPKEKMRIEDFDYVLTQYKNTQIQPCMDFFIQNITARGYPIVYQNPTMILFEVKNEEK